MTEYKEPIQISGNDPICSVSALEGTVIGILFEKTGEEVQNAINCRVASIEEKISRLEKAIKGADTFVDGKSKEIEELDDLYEERDDAKRAQLEPLRRQSKDIWNQIRNEEHTFNKATEQIIASQAVSFEDGFEEAEKNLLTVDELIDQENKLGFLRAGCGYTGIQGAAGSMVISGDGSSSTYTITDSGSGNIGLGVSDPDSYISSEEDLALARLNTLKHKVKGYLLKIEKIRAWIRDLQEEKRRLTLIRDNLTPARDYKLDLNKLSAFGFEDIEIV